MKKFLLICSYFPSVIKFRGYLLADIQQRGFEIHIFAPDLQDYPQDVQHLQQLGYHLYDIPLHRTGTNPLKDMATVKVMYGLMKKIRPDYLLAYTIKPVIYGLMAGAMAKVPHRFALITGLGYAFQGIEQEQKSSLFQQAVFGLYRQALKSAEKVFFQNPDDLALFQKMALLQPGQPTVVVNGSGVNVQEFDVLPLPTDEQQHVKPSFLLIGRLLADKGVREYIDAIKLVKQQSRHAEFHLVGWIDENPTAVSQQELDEWIADGLIHFWGKLADVRPAIAQSSVYVLPSYREGTPRTVLEAMAMGRAIITTDAPGCRETVIDGQNGFLVEVKSAQDLANAMQKLIEHPKWIAEMGQASRQLALQKYDVHQVNHHMMTEMGILES